MQKTFYMLFPAKHRWTCLIALSLCMVLLAACGSSPTTAAPPTAAPTATATDNGGYVYPTPAATATPTSASTSGSLLGTGSATVSGSSKTVLTNAQGLTLYYRTSDAPPSNVCSGGCASAWPPLIASGSGTPTSSASLPGQLTVITTPNGQQVAYNGHLLYTYAADTAPGQATGEGVGGVWHVATPDLAA